MKQITCEICGSNELIKQDEVFVCQYCRTQYSPEETKKMIEGTVKIDNSDKINNLYILAHRARDDDNYESAVKYYEMILQENPYSWEAAFYKVYYSSMQSIREDIPNAEERINKCAASVLKLIKDKISEKNEQQKAVTEVALRVNEISEMFAAVVSKYYTDNTKYSAKNILVITDEYIKSMLSCANTLYNIGDRLVDLFDEKYASDLAVDMWKSGVKYGNSVGHLVKDKSTNRQNITQNTRKIQNFEPDYKPPLTRACYVATSVYGSYDCPQVWILRRFRDYSLAKSWYGKLFILIYYSTSPTLVKLFGKNFWFRKICLVILNELVNNLRSKGFKDTPYDDMIN
ncbi:MAG: hypothetical protein LBL93_06020 [Ruminococcus sp.]|jgi:tetratricopeptide (TPR) repeat protein|nr:hypothetical protein [Ruminococcus sp.]